MLHFLRQINGVVEPLVGVVFLAFLARAFVGGRRGLRNPWVYVPLAWSIAALCFCLFMAYRSDQPDPGTTYRRLYAMGSALGVPMLCSVLIGPLIAMWAGVRRATRIDRLIRVHEMSLDVQWMLEQPESYERAIRTRAPGLMTRADLDELLPLVRQTRGAPGYD
ncbi:MAG: hypothetical protein ABIZ70_04815, partial [Gemmatimonadales bacterium]